jgi:hypothetical protein
MMKWYRLYRRWSNRPHHFEPASHKTLSHAMDKVGRRMGWVSWIADK